MASIMRSSAGVMNSKAVVIFDVGSIMGVMRGARVCLVSSCLHILQCLNRFENVMPQCLQMHPSLLKQ
jgi:hypothetical protein